MATTSEEGHIVASDGVRLALQWDRPETPVGTVVVAHGYREHLRRQQNLADACLSIGLRVLRYDMRGHGRSGGRRGHIQSFNDYIVDLRQVLALAAQEGEGPLFLVAHSQGGLITLHALFDAPLPVQGIVLSNPAVATKVDVPEWKKTAARLLSRVLPTFGLPSSIPPETISRDAASVAEYSSDPLIFPNDTTRWGWEFMTAQREAQERSLHVTVPLLAQIGTGDQLIDPAVGESWCNRITGDDVTVTAWPGFYHELYNEPEADRERVLGELTDWLSQRIA